MSCEERYFKCDFCSIKCKMISTVSPSKCLIGDFDSNWEEVDSHEIFGADIFPSWCKAGAWCFSQKTGYQKVKELKNGKILTEKGVSISPEDVSEARAFTNDERRMKALVGKLVYRRDLDAFYIVTGFFNGKVLIGVELFNAIELFDYFEIDGKPVGIFEHVSEDGTWVE